MANVAQSQGEGGPVSGQYGYIALGADTINGEVPNLTIEVVVICCDVEDNLRVCVPGRAGPLLQVSKT